MGLLDKVKAGAEQAASTAQKQAQTVATKRELSQAYSDLGRTAFGLVDRGEISHGDLAAGVDHIRELQSRLSGEGGAAADGGSSDAEGEADIVE
jgi:hypothetical protein